MVFGPKDTQISAGSWFLKLSLYLVVFFNNGLGGIFWRRWRSSTLSGTASALLVAADGQNWSNGPYSGSGAPLFRVRRGAEPDWCSCLKNSRGPWVRLCEWIFCQTVFWLVQADPR